MVEKKVEQTETEFNFRELTSFEKCCDKVEISTELPGVENIAERFRKPLISFYKLMVEHEAVNDKYKADYSNPNQPKWGSIYDLSSGCRFVGSDCGYGYTGTDFGPRLASESKEKEEFFAQTFHQDIEGVFK